MTKKILFLVPYPLHQSPSQRFRFEQYFQILNSKDYSYTIQSFLNTANWKVFYSTAGMLAQQKALISGFIKRSIAIAKSPQYDFVFIDCPPSVGMLTVNSLVASSALIMPVQAEYLPLQA